ncbi:MAG: SRPBCC family protein [Acidimicrobiia bacterium]|nr:SRPBCC family protein [Acidimicrobiia bacterium]
MGYDIDQRIFIDAPPERVWTWVVEDVERERRWRNIDGTGVLTLEKLDDGPVKEGTRFHGTVKAGPGKPQAYTNVVTELDDHRRIAWETTDAEGPTLGHGVYELTPESGGTRFRIRLAYPARTFVGRIMRPIMRFMGGRFFIPKMLEKLKRLVEADLDS